MTLLSPSVIRLERPIDECIQILNDLWCESVHIDVCHEVVLSEFIGLDVIQTGLLQTFKASITLHLFRTESGQKIHLPFLRANDLAILHIFPKTTETDIATFLEETKVVGCRAGLAVDLRVEPTVVTTYLSELDTVFVMSIPVGMHGLPPDKSTMDRLLEVRSLIEIYKSHCRVGLDGGVNVTTFRRLVAQVDELVIGSLLFDASNLREQWQVLQTIMKGGNR